MRFVPFVLLVMACSAEYEVRIRASPSTLLDDAIRAEVAVVANCLSQDDTGPVTGDPHLYFSLDETPPSLGPVPEGNHGLFARLVDGACNVVAAGCEDIEIEDGGSALLQVNVEAAMGSACDSGEVCRAGECMPGGGPDAGVDVPADVGMDAPSEAGSDAPTDVGVDAMDAAPDVPIDAPIDSGVDAGDPCSRTLFCEDFEAPTLNPAFEIDAEGTSTIALSGAQAHSGGQSVLVHASPGVAGTSFGLSAFDTAEVGERWVRAWYFLPAYVGLTPLAFEAADNALTLFSTGEDYTAIDTYLFPGGDSAFPSRLPLRQQVWTCIEMGLDFDGPNTAELYIDGVRVAEMDIALPNAFHVLRFGAPYRDPDDPPDYDIYIDDVATSTQRIGCN